MTQDMVKMMSQDKMIGRREILFSSPSPWFSRFLRAMLLLVMVTLGVGNVWGQDLPFVVTTDINDDNVIDETEKHYYLLQSYGNTGFFMRQNIETTTSTKSDVVTTLNILTDDMKWYFLESDDDGYYYICDINNKYLYFAQPSGSTSSRTWMQLKALDDTDKDHYKFSIAKNNTQGWDAFNIIPKGNTGKYCLNKRGRNASADGIQIINDYNDENSNWIFIPVSSYKWTLRSDCFRVSDSNIKYYYKINSQSYASYYIKPGTNYVQTSNVNDDDMIWFFEEAGSDELMTYYYIRHANTEKYLHYRSTGVGETNAIDLVDHIGNETGDDEARFQFIVVRGTNNNESLDAPGGIIFNIVPILLKSTSSDVSIKSVSCDGGQGKALKTKSDRMVNTTHWSFVPATFTGAWADPVITCDETGTVTITGEDGAAFYYTLDDNTPTIESSPYDDSSKPTVNPGKTTIKVRSIAEGKKPSNVVTETIVYNPTITLTAASYTYNRTAYLPVSSVDYVDSNNPENNISFEVNTDYIVSYKKEDNVVDECINADTYTIVLTDVDGGDYIVCGTGNFTIDKATLSVTAKPKVITYGAEPANDGVTYEGFVGTETEDVLGGTLGYDYTYTQYGDVSDAEHTYTITPKGLSSTNYTFNYIPGTLTVNPKEVGLTWSTTTSFPYDGMAHTLTATATGTVNGDVIGVTVTTWAKEGSSLTGYDAINAGSYTATASTLTLNGTDTPAGNYTLPVANTQDFTINKITLTIKANDNTITYGDAPAGNGVTYSGFIEGENENTEGMFTGTLGYTSSYSQFGDVGDTYTITPDGLTAANYDITFKNGTLTVNQKEVGIEWSNTSLPYNGSERKPTATATGLVNNDVIGVTVTGAQTNIGTGYTATATGLTGGGKEGNYKLPPENSESLTTTFEITTAVLIVTANDKTIIYGDAPANDGVTYSGFIAGEDATSLGLTSDAFSYSYNTAQDGSGTAYLAGSDAGSYYIIPSGLTLENYEVRFVAGTLTVDQKEVGIEWENTSMPYNGHEQKPSATVSATDLVNNDVIEVTVTTDREAIDVADDYTATATGLTGDKAGNYKLPAANTHDFTISQKALTVTAKPHTITYGDEPANEGVTFSGFIEGESENTEGMFTGTLSYVYNSAADGLGDAYTTTSNVGSYFIIPSGLTATNYNITFENGTLTVGPKTVSNPMIEISETSFEYNRTEKKPDVTSVKDGDTVIPSGQYQWSWSNNINAAESTAENPPTVIVTNVDNGNYTINGTVTFTITPKSIGNGTTSAEGVVISFDENENVKITCPIENLIKDKDFTVDGPTDEVWTITGKGNYSGGAQVMRIVEDFYNTGVDTGENVKDVAAFQPSTDMVISGKDVYIVTDVNLTKNKVVLSKIAYAPKDTPVLLLTDLEGTGLETTAGIAATPIQVETGDEADTSGNILKRVSGAEGLQVTFGKVFLFYLGKFVLTTEGTLEAGSFYFDNPNPPSSSAAGVRLSIVIDETTDIDGIKEYDNTGTAIDRWYSLDGRRLNGKPTKKGLYIKNGQKVVVK